MSQRAEECRKKAAECEQRAIFITEDRLRTLYLKLARQWRQIAGEVEVLERGQS
jgi:hypothetical protein